MPKKYLISFVLLLVLGLGLFPHYIATAQIIADQTSTDYKSYKPGFEIIPPECLGRQDGSGDSLKRCDLNSVAQLFINLSYLGLKTLPYISVLMIIVAGFTLMSSGGSTERVQQGKKMASSVIIGIFIALFLSWGLAAMTVTLLTGDTKGILFTGYGPIWSKEWWGGVDNNQPTSTTGCCVINDPNDVGCLDGVTEINCTARSGTFVGLGKTCSEYENPRVGGCSRYKSSGCCTKTENNIKTSCQPAINNVGCVTYQGYAYEETACINIVGPAGSGCGPQP